MRVAKPLRDEYEVTAIVSSFDNGGSFGRVRQAFGTPLTGDLRRALHALSTNEWGPLTEFRFEKGDVKGHALGNLILAAVFEESKTTQEAVEKLNTLFAVKGRALAVSHDLADLYAELEDGTIVKGEDDIDEPRETSHIPIKKVYLGPVGAGEESGQPKHSGQKAPQKQPAAAPAPGVLEAIEQADLIIMGPGDVYTSIIPCLLVEGVRQSLQDCQAKKIYLVNAFTKWGQTNNFTASDHVRALEQYLAPNFFDTVILETAQIDPEVVKSHGQDQETLVKLDIEKLEKEGYAVLSRDLLKQEIIEYSRADVLKRSKIGLDAEKVISLVKELI